MKNVRYVPGLSDEDLAMLCGVKIVGVRKFLRSQGYDCRYDTALLRYRRVQQCKRDAEMESRKLTAQEISDILSKKYGAGYSLNNVKYFLNHAPEPGKTRKTSKTQDSDNTTEQGMKIRVTNQAESSYTFASVSDEDSIILRTIQKRYLRQDSLFDCDLTFGKGDFYSVGIEYPRICFDKYPQDITHPDAPEVHSLEDVSEYVNDNSLDSVIIDLPQSIGTKDGFKDIHDLAISYYEMLKIAYDKLKYETFEQPGGILVVKVGDIPWQGQRIRMSKVVTDIATGNQTKLSKPIFDVLGDLGIEPNFDMQLIDKFLHTYAMNEIDLSALKDKQPLKTHDYYLVFRKKPHEYQRVYSPEEIEETYHPSIHFSKKSDDYLNFFVYGKKVSTYESKVTYIVPAPKPDNHIGITKSVDKTILKVFEKYHINERTGGKFIKRLAESLAEKDGYKLSPFYGDGRKYVYAACKELVSIGVDYIEWPDGTRVYINPTKLQKLNTSKFK